MARVHPSFILVAASFIVFLAPAWAGEPASSPADSAPPPLAGISRIAWQGGRLTLDASAVDLRALLAAISETSRIPIVLDEAVPPAVVSWQGEAQPIEKAIDGILAAGGRTDCLMASGKDGEVLLVSRNPGGGLSPRALEAMEVATLSDGRSVSFFPRELVVVVHLPGDQGSSLRQVVSHLEQGYGLSFLGKTAIQDRLLLRFRVLGGARVIDRAREIWAASEGRTAVAGLPGEALEVVVPNGLAVSPEGGRVEMPAHDLYVKAPMTTDDEGLFLQRVREVGFVAAEVEKWSFMRLGRVGCEEISNKRYFYFQGSFQLMVDSRDRGKFPLERLLTLFAEEGGFIYGVERYSDSAAYLLYFPDLSSDETHCAKFARIEEKLRQSKVSSGTVLSPLGWSSYLQPKDPGARP